MKLKAIVATLISKGFYRPKPGELTALAKTVLGAEQNPNKRDNLRTDEDRFRHIKKFLSWIILTDHLNRE